MLHSTSRRLVGALAVLLLVVGVAAACSDDGGDDSASDQPAADDGGGAGTEASGGDEGAGDEADGGGEASGDLPDPCSLLTVEEIDAATGQSFGEGTFNDSLSSDTTAICDWLAEGDGFATAQVLVVSSDVYDDNKAGAEDALGGVVDVEVAGADAAYATSEGSIVAMRVGDLFLQVSYIPTGPGEVTDATVQLAEAAVGQLP